MLICEYPDTPSDAGLVHQRRTSRPAKRARKLVENVSIENEVSQQKSTERLRRDAVRCRKQEKQMAVSELKRLLGEQPSIMAMEARNDRVLRERETSQDSESSWEGFEI